MQAGNLLRFIETSDVTKPDSIEQGEMLHSASYFIALCTSLFDRHKMALDSHVSHEDSGIVTVEEIQLRITAPNDGSYLHIVPFRHRDDEGVLDCGLAVIEHDATGALRDGYMYMHDATSFLRTPIQLDDGTGEPFDDAHFSIVAMYQDKDELLLYQAVADDAGQEAVVEAYDQFEETAEQHKQWVETLGCVPGAMEILELASLLTLAEPHQA